MMCCGVLNIDTIRDYLSPIQLIMSRIPKEVLEAQYKIKLPERDSDKYTGSIFL
jgi:large subunit GTPase 1